VSVVRLLKPSLAWPLRVSFQLTKTVPGRFSPPLATILYFNILQLAFGGGLIKAPAGI